MLTRTFLDPGSSTGAGPATGRMVLAAALIFVVLVGGTDAGRYITAVRALTAAIGAAFVVTWLIRAPRETDRVDRLALGSLLLFLLACVTSQFPRMSFDAAVSATAFTAALFIGRRAVSNAATHAFAITLMGLIGLVVAVVFAVLWGLVWARWISIAGSLPPLDLILPVGPYRQYHVVGMTVALLLPAQAVLARRREARGLGIVGLVASSAVIVMSGSRTIWLAVAVVSVAALALFIARHGTSLRRRLPGPAIALFVILGVTGAVVVGGIVLTRLLGTSTIELRAVLWQHSLDRWLTDPLTGTGPGSFSSSLTLSGFFGAYNGVGRHADNALIQALSEAGLVGLGSLGLLAAALLVGARRNAVGAPIAGLALLAMMSLTDNPTDSAHLVVIGIAWMALATPTTTPQPASTRIRWLQAPVFLAAAIVGVVVTMHLVAAVNYDRAVSASTQADGSQVRDALTTAVALDPSYALYRRNRAAWLLADGQTDVAVLESRQAVALNPGDATAWRVAAMAAATSGNRSLAARLAARATELRTLDPVNAETQAYLALREDKADAVRTALTVALRWNPWVAGDQSFSSTYADADVGELVRAARESWITLPDTTGRQEPAQAWLAAMVGEPMESSQLTLIDAAASAVIDCNLASAKVQTEDLSPSEGSTADALLVRILVLRAGKEPTNQVLALAALRWPLLGLMAGSDLPGRSPMADAEEDARLYSRNAITAPRGSPSLPTFESGLSAWLREPRQAAARGAPDSGLAECAL